MVDRPFQCADPKVEHPRDDGSDRLRSGATAALLCYWDADSEWTAPDGPLTTNVDRLVDLVNSRRAVHYANCNLTGGPAWSIVFRYRDGTRTIEGDDGGCETMFVGPTEKAGAPRVWAAFLGALGDQRRAAQSPDAAVHSPACPARLSMADLSVVAQPELARAATWCVLRGPHWVSAGPVNHRQLAALRHEFSPLARGARFKSGYRECHGLPRTSYGMVVGRDPWGEPFAIDFYCDAYRIFPTGSPRAELVEMTPEMRSLVARAVVDPALRP